MPISGMNKFQYLLPYCGETSMHKLKMSAIKGVFVTDNRKNLLYYSFFLFPSLFHP